MHKKYMKRFYENFSDEEANEIVKQFLSWTELEADDGELPDDVTETVMELAISKEFASREETCEMVFEEYEIFKFIKESKKKGKKE